VGQLGWKKESGGMYSGCFTGSWPILLFGVIFCTDKKKYVLHNVFAIRFFDLFTLDQALIPNTGKRKWPQYRGQRAGTLMKLR
jgi:hypothetical protein